ncbi:MAG: beta-ketoacyl-[acyl-carrier-protein] synthase II [Planctomycetota bacterium]|nr:MAG: beta-ketoacyl-[acyl-carrier-protein] synthase II [Planctomycetota bacterium]
MTHPNGRRVVITGYGAVTDLAHSAPGTWEAMRDGRSGIAPTQLPDFDQFEGWTVTIAGQVREWSPDFLDHREAKRMDRCTLLGLAAAEEAVRHSGLDFNAGDPTARGIVVGSGIGGIKTIEDGVVVLHNKGPGRLSPFTVPRLMVNAVTGNISIRFNLQGPASAHATACASSGHAIGDAMGYIRRGQAEVMLAGGAEAAVTPLCIGAFMTMKALSTRNDEPTKASRPFDADRDGFVLAEGAAMFVLESEEYAKARGANILGELVGFGNSSDAGHITAPDAEGRGATNAMRWALKDSGLNTSDINYINAHGTSTPLGDKAEVHAVKTLFGDRAAPGNGLVMSSTKSVHGHTLGASGAVEMIACLHAINDGVVAPTINLDTIDPDCAGIDLVPNQAREMPVRYAMNNTFGFGGHNVCLIVGKYDG